MVHVSGDALPDQDIVTQQTAIAKIVANAMLAEDSLRKLVF